MQTERWFSREAGSKVMKKWGQHQGMEKGRYSRNNTKGTESWGQKKDQEMTEVRKIAFYEI